MHRSVDVDLGERSYPIVVGEGTWDVMARSLENPRPGTVALVTDEKVGSLYGAKARELVDRAGFDHLYLIVPQGEKSKSFHHLEYICREMALAGVGRDGIVMALGGGVVGDLAGMAASTYLRGIRFVQLPTTLLAMVDSSVGGKTGINIAEGKNLVGTFYQPEGVYAEIGVLETLDVRDWYSGIAEATKIALSMDADLFNYLESVADLGPDGDLDITRIVLAACEKKADVVRQDEKESGLRRVLNFGHTLGHAIEAALGYGTVRHGEAIVLGMRAAVRLSVDRCGFPRDQYERVTGVLEKIPVPDIDPAGENFELFMRRDKKSTGRKIQSVLICDIGRYQFVELEDPGDLLEAYGKAARGE